MPKNIIRVTFKDNETEDKLYEDIMNECKIVGQSAWMKQAAIEKLESDKGIYSNGNSNNISNVNSIQKLKQSEFIPNNHIVNSLDDLMK